jgi:hypothetical protein
MMHGSFNNSPFYASVMQARDFMFGDITKTLKLAENNDIGAPNFLLALGLCCYTEYWGKLKCGIAQNKSQKSFEAFLVELDKSYYEPIKSQIYRDVRCGLAHAYMIENRSSAIDALNEGPHGISFDSVSDSYTFYVRTYFEEFKKAVTSYLVNLENGTESVSLLETALLNRPELL